MNVVPRVGALVRPAGLVAVLLGLCAMPAVANAQELGSAATGPSPLLTAIGLAVLGLVPFVLVVTTSFAKIAVVLSILRSALGTQNVPPNVVLASLAVILSAYVMAPVATQTLDVVEPMLEVADDDDLATWMPRVTQASEPLRAFLQANSGAAELALFADLRGHDLGDAAAGQTPPGQAPTGHAPTEAQATMRAPLSVVVPAFAITELSEAFQIGFLLFLPFLVLDLFVGSVLLSLGMHMLSPTTVSMPFKLLLFVLVNGWIVLSQSLVLGYSYPGGGG